MRWLGLVIRCISLLQFSFTVVCTSAKQAKTRSCGTRVVSHSVFFCLLVQAVIFYIEGKWMHPLTEHTLLHTSEIASALLRAFDVHWVWGAHRTFDTLAWAVSRNLCRVPFYNHENPPLSQEEVYNFCVFNGSSIYLIISLFPCFLCIPEL